MIMPPYLTADAGRELDDTRVDDWHTARQAAIVRDAWRCAKCRTTTHLDVHHRAPRGMGGSSNPNRHNPDRLLTLCRTCHDWVETHRTHAYRNGWLIRTGTDPATVPTLIAGRWWLLHPDGGRTETRPPTEIE